MSVQVIVVGSIKYKSSPFPISYDAVTNYSTKPMLHYIWGRQVEATKCGLRPLPVYQSWAEVAVIS